jgi:hypothetical protein
MKMIGFIQMKLLLEVILVVNMVEETLALALDPAYGERKLMPQIVCCQATSLMTKLSFIKKC